MNKEQITVDSFDEDVLRSDEPVLVGFVAEGCPPGRLMESVLDSINAGYSGELRMLSIDGWEAAPLIARFAILSLPTLVLFVGGREVDRLVGLRSAQRIAKMLKAYLHEHSTAGRELQMSF